MWGIETVLIEKEKQLLAYILDFEMSEFVMGELKRNDITVHTGCRVQKIELNEEGLPVVFMDNDEKIETDYVFLCLGVEPAVELATAAGLEIGKTGAIAVNENLQTSDPHIYAGGDCIESSHLISGEKVHIRMGSLANRHGYVIAENIIGNKIKFPSITGACVIKVFNMNVGSVGLTEQSAAATGLAVKAVYGTFADKPDYHPESKLITVKMLYNDNDKLIGLQAVGEGDICRRVDTFSVLLQKGATIDDLYDFEHGYAPAYSEGLDPLHQLAGVARAEQRGYKFINPAELRDDENIFCLDVREVFETEITWPNLEKIKESGRYINIPLNDLPDNIDKLNPKARILIICGRGSRSYQAAVMLEAAGFKDIVVIGGGTKAAMSQSSGE
jgi:rhodanese-related sulfurtransferase